MNATDYLINFTLNTTSAMDTPTLTEVIANFCDGVSSGVIKIFYVLAYIFVINYVIVPRSYKYFKKYWGNTLPVDSAFEHWENITSMVILSAIFYLIVIAHIQKTYYLWADIIIGILIIMGLIAKYIDYKARIREKPETSLKNQLKSDLDKLKDGLEDDKENEEKN